MALTLDGTNGIVSSGSITTQSATGIIFSDSSSLPAASSPYVLKNRIINGAMQIDQRNAGASQSITSGSANYTVDRWQGYSIGSTITGQQVAGATANSFNYKFTGSASNTNIVFLQKIESANSYDLAGTTVTLSATLANSTLTTVSWIAYYANSTDNFGTINAAPNLTTIASGSWTVTSSLARYSTQISIPSAATTGIQISLFVTSQISGTWTIGNVQLEQNTVATPFERRLYNQELANCQRYYWKRVDTSSNTAFATVACYSASDARGALSYTQMRTAPAISFSGSFFIQVSGAVQPTVTSANMSTSQITDQTALIVAATSGLTTGQAAVLIRASGTCFIDASAEL